MDKCLLNSDFLSYLSGNRANEETNTATKILIAVIRVSIRVYVWLGLPMYCRKQGSCFNSFEYYILFLFPKNILAGLILAYVTVGQFPNHVYDVFPV